MDNSSHNNLKNVRMSTLFVVSAVAAILGMLVQCIAVLFGYDPSMHVFKNGTVFGTLSGAALFVLSAVILVYSVTIMKKNKVDISCVRVDNLTSFLSAMCGTAMMVSSAIVCLECYGSYEALSTVSILLFAVSVPAGMYYILFAINEEKFSSVLSVLGFFPPLWGVGSLMRIYFDSTTVINDPVRVLFQLSIVAVMLAFLFELRTRVGKHGVTAFVASSLVALLLGLCSGLSVFLLYFITKTVTTGEMLLSGCEIVACLYLYVRSYAISKTA